MAKKVLIIEDDSDVVESIKLRLEADHYEVVSAANGEEGLKVFEAQKPDLILLDVTMPVMDGHTFVKIFKSKYSLRDVPIIVLTGKDGMEDVFRLEGVKNFLTKPCNADELLQKIEDSLPQE